MTSAELAEAAGRASDGVRLYLAAAAAENEWLQTVLREIAERAGVAPLADADLLD